MEKAYDLKDLISKLKNRGVEVGEEAAKGLVIDTFAWLEESAKLSENKADDLLAGFYPSAKAYVLEQADKIDGKIGN